uniref:Alpha-crystallin A chain n=1 Tax=Astyanax mexicanus TaxID=7994 RepID=O93592_ASTMX|nr:alpha-A-crystallin [Astyanax mexicanus]
MDIAIQHPWFRRALGYPSRLFDQFFGEGLFDYDLFPYATSTVSPYYRYSLFRNFLDSSNSGMSEVRSDRDKFMVYLDVKHFSPEELNVKVAEDYVEIQGKHGERQMTMATSPASSTAATACPPTWTSRPSPAPCRPMVCSPSVGPSQAAQRAAVETAAFLSPVTTRLTLPPPLRPPHIIVGGKGGVSGGLAGALASSKGGHLTSRFGG